ncbi:MULTISPECIES: DAK2 domain-containing protein [Actinoplanes]|uniref:DAK2 domain-containing protein n=1 Tax=Actinoplanes TaxID=1865 RepID=UPI0005F2C40D|nr:MULTISPECIES: DAK2 domain-containing protein [Actinoplanes]GLY04909.1 dihydroxyacetone kinase [Actinoplanes sp. NBRC 101535]
MLDTLDAAAVRRWCDGGLASLRAHQHEIDELNVYPVPDGDTGTNLVLTMVAAHDALAAAPDVQVITSRSDGSGSGDRDASGMWQEPPEEPRAGPAGRLMRLMARGALLGARGNSGVIVSQILRGMADSFAASVAVRGVELAGALRTATEAAYAAVARPVEGTVLSVVAAAAEGAGRIKSDDLVAVARAAAAAASEALARTPQQLPVLARAGVVDAGGRGLCLLLDALVAVVTEETTDMRTAAERPSGRPPGAAVPHHHAAAGEVAYEVQYLLDATEESVARLRTVLDGLGDSLVVVGTGDGDPPTWHVHVHVTDIGPAVEAGIEAGRPYQLKISALEERRPDRDARGAVVVATGDGLTALFEAEGATVVERNPSTAEILAAIRATGAGTVVLLPNDANTHAVAVSAAREADGEGIRVSVVPTRSPVQALAALAVRDDQRPFADDVIAMAEAAGACRYGEVCTAQRDSFTVAGPCRAGDLLGLVDGEVHVIGTDPTEVSHRLLDRMLGGGGELVTLVLGADAPPELGESLRGHVHRTWPFIELQCYAGGQPRYHLLAGVE